MICRLCHGPDATITRQQINGLPADLPACALCRDRIRRRDLGVTIKPDGSLSVYGTDGRGTRYPPDVAIQAELFDRVRA